MYRLEIELPLSMFPMNTATTRRHWSSQKRHADNVRTAVMAMTARRRPRLPLKEARITITRHSSVEPDDDNMRFAMKPLVDAFTRTRRTGRRMVARADVIYDDDPKHLIRVYHWQPAAPKAGKVSVLVEELAPGTIERETTR